MRKSFAAVALIAVIGLGVAGCGEDAESPGADVEDFGYVADASPEAPDGGQGAGTPADSPSVAAMEDERFWQILAQSGASAGGSVEDQTESLTTILAGLPAPEIAAFDVAFSAYQDELYSWDLWGAAYLLMGGCSDDCFTDFRSWVIAQGEDYFEAVQADPQALAEGRLENVGQIGEAELLSYAAMDAYVEATDRDIFMDYPSHPGLETVAEPTGQEWDEDDEEALRDRYPRLSPLPY
ncbi:DUF4240 domain-containing protein [Citricoccus muralis]|uniref:Uncharacterized protein DUF4240 n=1 Tax=Citricoccus muralis TaxID=169134 RepID=A0A3D9LAM8_9MICC|nr:DUF4240 domain-containing protein [Citricoccus muralis]REE02283.1 uncharacterized protein DUF4240 [Citricoccus muralis]